MVLEGLQHVKGNVAQNENATQEIDVFRQELTYEATISPSTLDFILPSSVQEYQFRSSERCSSDSTDKSLELTSFNYDGCDNNHGGVNHNDKKDDKLEPALENNLNLVPSRNGQFHTSPLCVKADETATPNSQTQSSGMNTFSESRSHPSIYSSRDRESCNNSSNKNKIHDFSSPQHSYIGSSNAAIHIGAIELCKDTSRFL